MIAGRWGLIVVAATWGSVGVAFAAPVTRADIAGKTICQDNGVTVTYFANGSAVSNRFGKGSWMLTENRLTLNGEFGYVTNTIEKEGNKFHIYRRLQVGTNFDTYGHYCN